MVNPEETCKTGWKLNRNSSKCKKSPKLNPPIGSRKRLNGAEVEKEPSQSVREEIRNFRKGSDSRDRHCSLTDSIGGTSTKRNSPGEKSNFLGAGGVAGGIRRWA